MELKKNFYFPLMIFLICFIALFAWLGWYNWPLSSDDFNITTRISLSNFWEFQKSYYLNENARIFTVFLLSICGLFPIETFYRVLASITILTYVLCVWIFVSVTPPQEISRKNKMLLTAIITASTLACNYSLKETLYWQPGGQYFWGTSLFLLVIALSVKSFRGSKSSFLACLIVLFLNGLMHEPVCVFQGVFAFTAMIYYAYVKDKRSALICCAFWLTSIAAFCVLYYSPTVAKRFAKDIPGTFQTFIPHLKRTLLIASIQGVLTSIKFFATPLIYIFLLFLPLIAKKIPASNTKLKIWQIVIAIYFIAFLMQALHGYALSGRSSLRVEAMTLWFMFFTWCCLWSLFYRGKLTSSEKFADFSRKFRYPFLILALLISFNFWDAIKDLKIAPAYRAEQAARAQEIINQRDSGVENVLVTLIENRPQLLYKDFSVAPESGYIAKHYGVKSILAIPKELSGDVEAINELWQGHSAALTKLAEAGNTDFIYELGLNSEPFLQHNINAQRKLPHGLEVSAEQAEKWQRMGANLGDARCMWPLARMIFTRDKSFKGISEAIYWVVRYQLANMRL